MSFEAHLKDELTSIIFVQRPEPDTPAMPIVDLEPHTALIGKWQEMLDSASKRRLANREQKLIIIDQLLDTGILTEAEPSFVTVVREAVRAEGVVVDDSYRYFFTNNISYAHEQVLDHLPPVAGKFRGESDDTERVILISSETDPNLSETNNYYEKVYLACHETVHGRKNLRGPVIVEIDPHGNYVNSHEERFGFIGFDYERGLFTTLLEEACATRTGHFAAATALRDLGYNPDLTDEIILGEPVIQDTPVHTKGVFALTDAHMSSRRYPRSENYLKAAVGLDMLCDASPEFSVTLLNCLNENTDDNARRLAVIAEEMVPGAARMLLWGNALEDSTAFVAEVAKHVS